MITTFIIQAIFVVITALLYPIDVIINTLIPGLYTALTSLGSYFVIIARYLGWAISVSGLSLLTLTLIVSYYTFVLTIPFFIWLIKIIVNWYHELR